MADSVLVVQARRRVAELSRSLRQARTALAELEAQQVTVTLAVRVTGFGTIDELRNQVHAQLVLLDPDAVVDNTFEVGS